MYTDLGDMSTDLMVDTQTLVICTLTLVIRTLTLMIRAPTHVICMETQARGTHRNIDPGYTKTDPGDKSIMLLKHLKILIRGGRGFGEHFHFSFYLVPKNIGGGGGATLC